MNRKGGVVQQVVQCSGGRVIAAQVFTVQGRVPAPVFGLADRPKPVAGFKAVGWHFGFLSVLRVGV